MPNLLTINNDGLVKSWISIFFIRKMLKLLIVNLPSSTFYRDINNLSAPDSISRIVSAKS